MGFLASSSCLVAALQQQRAKTQAEYVTGMLNDLAQTDQKIGESTQDLIKAKRALQPTTLRAPIPGTVQQLMVHTIGGVVSSAQSLLTIVPDGGPLMVEASIQNQDIGFVHVGQEAEVKSRRSITRATGSSTGLSSVLAPTSRIRRHISRHRMMAIRKTAFSPSHNKARAAAISLPSGKRRNILPTSPWAAAIWKLHKE
ncbi:MAG: HlyD family efflux transporter periplasmic adaptor subunit [Rhodospirillales bacterium]|nr:HlyD family efflux transporter periplasmic adaptor subunit [Rhodospirillales bacterium]